MDPLSMIMIGGNVLGLLGSAFGKDERKSWWENNPLMPKKEAQMQNAYRSNLGQAQHQANMGSFLDNRQNMQSMNAGMGNLMQQGGAYSGAQLRAVGAQNTANKALNYGNTLQSAAQAAQMRIGANNEMTNQYDNLSRYMMQKEEMQPDTLSRIGMVASGLGNSLNSGLGQGQVGNNLMLRLRQQQLPSR